MQRYSRRTRWLHTLVYLATSLLFATGGWLFLGHEGDPSVLARLVRLPDTELHVYVGWGLTALAAGTTLLGWRGLKAFVRETFRSDAGDLKWFAAWPAALFTGAFRRHEGHFDPGQRLANVAIVGLLIGLLASGITLVVVSEGPVFVWAARIHRWSTFALTPILVGHIVVAAGLFPGYRGVWRSIHWRGDLPTRVAQRLWPVWTEKELKADPRKD